MLNVALSIPINDYRVLAYAVIFTVLFLGLTAALGFLIHTILSSKTKKEKKALKLLKEKAKTDVNAKKRLETMRECYDGFKIAERDLEMRGPGDFLRQNGETIRQSGGVKFRLADICDDAGVLSCAFAAAKNLTLEDPTLESYPELLSAVSSMFDIDPSTLN